MKYSALAFLITGCIDLSSGRPYTPSPDASIDGSLPDAPIEVSCLSSHFCYELPSGRTYFGSTDAEGNTIDRVVTPYCDYLDGNLLHDYSCGEVRWTEGSNNDVVCRGSSVVSDLVDCGLQGLQCLDPDSSENPRDLDDNLPAYCGKGGQ